MGFLTRGSTSGPWRARAHRTALEHDWDAGLQPLLAIIRKQCDLGTALTVYWLGQPDMYRRYANRDGVPAPRGAFDMLVEIERNVVAGFYAHRNIPFDPYEHGACRYRRKRSNFHCYLPDAMYQVVGMPEPGDREVKPMRGDLPVGLAALADASAPAADARGQALAALASFEDSAQPVVEMEADRVIAIHLRSHGVCDADLALLSHFPEVTKVELGQQITDAGLVHLAHLPNLQVLGLSASKVTPAGLARLSHLDGLRVLDLDMCKLRGDGLRHLAQLPALRVLSLADASLDRTAVAQLAELQNVRVLFLGLCRSIKDNAVKPLSKLEQLQALVVTHTNMTERGLAKLRDALPDTRVESDELHSLLHSPWDTD